MERRYSIVFEYAQSRNQLCFSLYSSTKKLPIILVPTELAWKLISKLLQKNLIYLFTFCTKNYAETDGIRLKLSRSPLSLTGLIAVLQSVGDKLKQLFFQISQWVIGKQPKICRRLTKGVFIASEIVLNCLMN